MTTSGKVRGPAFHRVPGAADACEASRAGSRPETVRRFSIGAISMLTLGALGACGGGGGSSSGGGNPPPSGQGDRVSVTASASASPVPSVTNTDLEFVVTNPSSAAASGVVLTVTLGNGLTRAGVRCAESGGASCPSDPQSMSVTSLPAGGTLRFTVSAIVAAGASGNVTSSGTVSASNDTVTSNNSAQVSISVYSADVRVLGSVAAGELRNGGSAIYSYTVANAGPDAARNVALAQTASSALAIASIECTASNGATCPDTSGTNMVVPLLPSGGTLAFVVNTQLTMDVVASASATMKATSAGDGVRANDRLTVSAKTRIPTSSGTPTFVELQSDAGDFVGGGYNSPVTRYSYKGQNATIHAGALGGLLTVQIDGDEFWMAHFQMPSNLDRIEPGAYFNRPGRPLGDPDSGGFEFFGEGRGCDQSGWFIIDDVVYSDGALVSVDLRFEQHCNELEPALRGQVHWIAGDDTRPPGPVNPPPPGLWTPPAGATPASGNYVYIASDPGDDIGHGRTETFTQVNSVITVEQIAGALTFGVNGDRGYGGQFKAMTPLTRLEPGYYGEAQGLAGNPTVGRLSVTGDYGCSDLTGWFVIDSISYSGDTMTGVDLRFEQHCYGLAPAVRGKVHWRADDPTIPYGPQVPPPSGLWVPPAQAIPATGNVVYLESDRGDFIARGLKKAYTPLDSVITVGEVGYSPVGNRFDIAVNGDEEWRGFFQAMYTLPDLQAGYYGNLQGFPSGNPAFGSISWSGEGRFCDPVGWFVIDSITYSGSSVDSIELRFEHRCYGGPEALHGYVRWSAADHRLPPPPQNPPPANLWAPPPRATPATGNYFYLESDADDYIGKGLTHLFKAPATTFDVKNEGSQVTVMLQEDAFWGGYFIPMVPLKELQVGYYGGLTMNNPAKGSVLWYGDGRACSIGQAWFVVDDVRYVEGTLNAIDVRFEQRCKGSTALLRGKLHWRGAGN